MQHFVEFCHAREEIPDTSSVPLTALFLEDMQEKDRHACILEAMIPALVFVHQSLSAKGTCAASTPAITWLVQEFVR